jgi:cystathionine beta-lyase/cystathionine gamma-synthase
MKDKQNDKDGCSVETLLAQAGSRWDSRTGAVTMPVYQTATFGHPALGQSTGFDYSRSGNPTRAALEETLAKLDGAARGFAFASGLAAIDAVFRLFVPGDSVIVTEDLYGGTFRLFEQVLKPYGITAVSVDTSDLAAVQAASVDLKVKGLFVESVTNPVLRTADIAALSKLAKERGWLFIVDNTFMTPYLLKPLALGADIAVYSASKYLGGHNDVVAGAVTVKDAALAERIGFFQNAVGAILGPQDSWLLLRGLKTLHLRLERQSANAAKIAQRLRGHTAVRKVLYPGIGGMLAFEVSGPEVVKQVLERVRVFIFAESLGGVESLITYPAVQTHADIPPLERARLGITDGLLRVSVGVEDADDLIADLVQALEV